MHSPSNRLTDCTIFESKESTNPKCRRKSVVGSALLILAEIEQFGTTIDYIKLCAGTKVIFLGQMPPNTLKVRDHLYENAAALKEAGVTHFAIEINEKPLNYYSFLCHELKDHGIKIIFADADQQRTHNEEQRAAYMAKCIMDILEAEPKAKVAALFSSFHAGRSTFFGLRPAATS